MRFDSFRSSHPDKATLLAWTEGELSWWRSQVVGRHVRSCWQCKGQTSELEAMVCAVGRGIAGLPEPSRVDVAKAYWRFREACLQIDAAPQSRRLRLKPAWAIAAAVILATAGLAFVTMQPHFNIPAEKQATLRPTGRSPRPADPVVATPVAVLPEVVKPTASLLIPELEEKRSSAVLPGPKEEELLAVEIQALSALHRSRFCLNSGITVSRAGSVVEISGFIQSQDQRDRLRGVLAGIGRPETVRLKFSDPSQEADAVPARMETQPRPPTAGGRVPPPIEAWLRDGLKVGSRITVGEMYNFMNSVVLESESISSEAWAIRHLTNHFPPGIAGRLSPVLTDQLLQMVDDHAIALVNSLQTLQGRLRPVVGKRTTQSRDAGALRSDEPWQDRVAALQQRAERVVSQLLESFSTAPVDSRAERDFSELLSVMDGQFMDCLARAADLRASIQTESAKALRVQSNYPDR